MVFEYRSFLVLQILSTIISRPGGIAELARLISNLGVSVKDIVHERAWVRENTFEVGVREAGIFFNGRDIRPGGGVTGPVIQVNIFF